MSGGPAAAVARIFDPARLTQAREIKGLTKHALAGTIGVSAAAIGQFEAGSSKPTGETLAAMALALGFPIGFFASGRDQAPKVQANFRSLRATSQTQRRQALVPAAFAAEVAQALNRHVRLPEVALPHYEPGVEPTADEIEEVAADARRALGVADGPVPHVVRLVESKGVVVTLLRAETNKVSAFSCPFTPRPVVVLTTNKNDKARSRMDAAHELGHLLMHHDADPGSQILEREANNFAAAFLMPADQIRSHLPRRLNWNALTEAKQVWGVSLAALLYRSRTLGVISEASYRRAMVTMGRQTWPDGATWRTREPADLGEQERPALLHRAFELAESRGITLDTLANEVCLPVDAVREVLGLDLDERPDVRLGAI